VSYAKQLACQRLSWLKACLLNQFPATAQSIEKSAGDFQPALRLF
jgi:hypothetical protein